MFRFYCRGEGSDFAIYKHSLKTALNDALLLFLSDYMTRIDSTVYMRRIDLKRKPPTFRVINKQTNIDSTTSMTSSANSNMVSKMMSVSGTSGSAQQLDEQEKLKLRKRHKSTGHEAYSYSRGNQVNSTNDSSTCVLKMNKSALETKLGQVLSAQNIRDDNQLNAFIIGKKLYK